MRGAEIHARAFTPPRNGGTDDKTESDDHRCACSAVRARAACAVQRERAGVIQEGGVCKDSAQVGAFHAAKRARVVQTGVR